MKRRRRRTTALLATLAVAGASAALAGAGTGVAHSATPSGTPEWIRATPLTFTTQTLEFKVPVGPAGSQETCDVEADLRIPAGVDAAHPAPAILTSNGFGGSKDSTGATASNASYAMQYAGQGYVTLSYSGLGFGKSTCAIELDSPAYDGLAGAALVDYLGGDLSKVYSTYTADGTGLTAGTWTNPVAVAPPVVLDNAATHDPRVGMIGGSYGGENQFAVASVSQKVDTIIPQITWNDLVYSLAPNNQGTAGDATDGSAPDTQTNAAPGVEKQQWVSLFFALGASQPVQGNGGPIGQTTCPGFDSAACTAKVQMDAMGYPDPATMTFAHSASAATYLSSIKIPVFLSQGQDDTLFNLREAITTYKTLKTQGNQVKMLWQQWGHSGGPVAGEADGTSPVPLLFDDLRYSAWFAKYLRNDAAADTGSEFEYYTPWLTSNGVNVTKDASGNVTAGQADTAQMSGAPSFPVGHAQPLYLSGGTATGTGSLVHDASQVTAGTADFAVSPDTTTSTTELSAISQTIPLTDTAGTFAAFSSPALTENADQVGSPTLTVSLAAPAIVSSQALTQLVLFAKLYDVTPGGTATLANRVISPVRVTDLTKPVVMHLPATVHRFPVGDHLEVVLSASDAAYKGNNGTSPVMVVDSATAPNTLTVPFTDPDGAVFTAAVPPAALPEAGLPVLLVAVGLAGGAAVAASRRRRTLA